MKLVDLQKFNLPDDPGVYFFMKSPQPSLSKEGENAKSSDDILYIGKATSLKSRVKSYFDDDILHTRGLHIANMVTLADSIKFETTRSVLEALLLETELIKKHKPKYNTISKDDKSYFVLVITEEDFPRVVLARGRDIDKENNLLIKSKFLGSLKKETVKVRKTFGPYPSGQYAKESLKLIRRIFPFRDKCNVFDKKTPWKKQPCFSYQIGLCPGTCAGVCDKKKYKRIIERLVTFLEGDGEQVRRDLENDMKEFSKKLQFEEAQKVKETLFALEHIRDAHLISRDIKEEDKNVRIEAYDIAHLSGQNRVGAMTVVLGGVLAKQEYKKFKITTDKNDDLGGLKELLERRLKHLDWGIPDIIVVDGDDRHLNLAVKILIENKLENSIKVVAVTKDKSHKAKSLTGQDSSPDTNEMINNFKKEIVMANAEAHRFSLIFHKNLRKKSFLKLK
jgi:excinuclease ABC subunit C